MNDNDTKVDVNEIESIMNYSLLKSRTFWTLVVIFLVNGYASISGQIPASYDVIINLVLTALGSYFHLSTAQVGNVSN